MACARKRRLEFLLIAGLSLAVGLAAWCGITFTAATGRIATIWLANGLVVGVLLCATFRLWPGSLTGGFVGNLTANLLAGDPLTIAIPLTVVNYMEIVAAAYSLRWFLGVRPDLSEVRQFLYFLVAACCLAPALAATLAATFLYLVADKPFGTVWYVWFLADCLGMMIVAPPLLCFLRGDLTRLFSRSVWPWFLVLLGGVTALAFGVFTQSRYPLLFLVVPALGLAVSKLGVVGAALGMPTLAVVALVSTGAGRGPFSLNPAVDMPERLLMAQLFLGTCLVLAYLMGSLVTNQRRAKAILRAEQIRLLDSQKRLAESEARYRLQAESLRTANERATLATESGGIGIWDLDVTNDRLIWDAKMYRLYGLEPRDDVGAYDLWKRYLHPDDREAAEQALKDGIDGKRPFDVAFRVIWDDGSVHYLRGCGRVTRDSADHILRIVGANWDITNQRIEEEQREIIIESAPNGMMIVNEAGMITLANSEVERIFDYQRRTLAGQSVEILMPEVFRAQHRVLRSRFTSGKTDRGMSPERHIVGRKQDGSPVTIEIRLSPVTTPRGRIVVASLFDVTERTRQAAILQEAEAREREAAAATNARLDRLSRHLAKARDEAEQANQAKSRFLAGVTHELRTPLHGILGQAELLSLEGGLNSTQAERLDVMMASGQHLLDMINSVLDMSLIEADRLELHPHEVELTDLVRTCFAVVRPAAESKGLALVLAPAARLRICVDPTRLRQVLINLIANAVKFTPAGSVEVRQLDIGAVIRLEVADTGPGVPAQHRDKLFQTFERLNAEAVSGIEGAGLGLAIAARLIRLMGGQIGYDDNPGGGSVFWLELPAGHTSSATETEAISRSDLADKGRQRVLVVDDEALNRSIARAFLSMAGHEVTCVDNGAAAVEAAATDDFDTILMDVRMPGMNGMEATRLIRTLPAPRGSVRVVAVTAQAFAQQIEMCLQAGMDSHVSKPFTQATLLAALIDMKARSRGMTDAGTSAVIASFAPGRPVFDPETLDDIIGTLSVEEVADHLEDLTSRCQGLLNRLRQPGVPIPYAALIDDAHKLAGGAGTFGFMAVAAAARQFEVAADTDSPEATTFADELTAAIEASIPIIRQERDTRIATVA